MILRPTDDADLLALVTEILTDIALPLDVRAMLAALLVRRDLKLCPKRQQLAREFCAENGAAAGAFRVSRMIRTATDGGYMVRATWPVPHVGRVALFSYVVGSRPDIVEMTAASGGAFR